MLTPRNARLAINAGRWVPVEPTTPGDATQKRTAAIVVAGFTQTEAAALVAAEERQIIKEGF